MFWIFIFAVIFAQGNGILVDQKDVESYKRAFYVKYGHYPKSYDEKMEVLMNCLSDKLLLKRANDLEVEKDPQFLKEWRQMSAYIDKKCESEGMKENVCRKIKERFLKIAKIRFVLEKEVVPIAKKKASESRWLLEAHENLKGKISQEKIKGYIRDVSRLKAFDAYVKKLIKLYNVKINEKALRSL